MKMDKIIIVVLMVLQVKGAIFIGILATAVIGLVPSLLGWNWFGEFVTEGSAYDLASIGDISKVAFQFDFAFGIIAILLGLIVIIHPGNIMALVPVIMGIYFMIDGIMKIQTAVDAKRFGVKSWWMILVSAIVTGTTGILLLVNPFESAVALTVLLGITLLADGISNIWIAAYTVKAIKKEIHADDKIYVETSDREDKDD